MAFFIFFLSLLFTICVHELSHCVASIFCGVKVEVFSIGFFKPYLHKKLFGIDWRITPWLIGGFCKIKGETTSEKDGLLCQPYYKKVIIILAGVVSNLIIALICYWINYKNIFLGLWVDIEIIKSLFSQTMNFYGLIAIYKPNLFLLQLSILNIFAFFTNLIPFPALDGSMLWLYLMEPVWKKNYVRNLNLCTKIGFWSLIILQAILIIWIYVK